MPKGNKSSASSGTRKKHAKKAKGDEDAEAPKQQQQHRPQRGQKKLSKAQKKALPKVKQYIPPLKPPAPPIPDPLDGQGLARTLPADLVVVLRRLGKKDEVTRRKGLEELREGWLNEALGRTGADEVERELKETALLSAVPVWVSRKVGVKAQRQLHNLAGMLQSPFHRSLALQLHTELLSIPSIRDSIIEHLTLSLLPGSQNRDVLGSWMVAALEEGRRAGGSGLRGWTGSTTWLASTERAGRDGRINLAAQLIPMAEYLSLSILDPPSLHDDIYPTPVAASGSVPPPKSQGKGKGKAVEAPPAIDTSEDDSLAEERWARYVVGGLTGLAWLLQQLSMEKRELPEELRELLGAKHLWTVFESSSIEQDTAKPLGARQPTVRRAGYALLGLLVDLYPAELERGNILEMISHSLLSNCWREKEATVWEASGQAIVKFLSSESSPLISLTMIRVPPSLGHCFHRFGTGYRCDKPSRYQ